MSIINEVLSSSEDEEEVLKISRSQSRKKKLLKDCAELIYDFKKNQNLFLSCYVRPKDNQGCKLIRS
jgi:hypothetical protein